MVRRATQFMREIPGDDLGPTPSSIFFPPSNPVQYWLSETFGVNAQ